jgi:hypothetical protein
MDIPGLTRTISQLPDILRLSAGGRQNHLAITSGQPNGQERKSNLAGLLCPESKKVR